MTADAADREPASPRRSLPLAAGIAAFCFALLPPPALAQSGQDLGPDCDPNYALVCVPIASDVDCAGGNGNGPAYVRGPVQIVGRDIYELDRDGDGIACEPTD